MTEANFILTAGKYGPWLAMLLMLAYVLANKVGPTWLAEYFRERKATKAGERAMYERFIDQNTQMIKFIASATEAIHELSRSVDRNTQQVYELTKVVIKNDEAKK